jgi:hypothetical protein
MRRKKRGRKLGSKNSSPRKDTPHLVAMNLLKLSSQIMDLSIRLNDHDEAVNGRRVRRRTSIATRTHAGRT